MDPEKALKNARKALKKFYEAPGSGTEEGDAAADLAEAFEALDGWLSKKGFLPKAWARPEATSLSYDNQGARAIVFLQQKVGIVEMEERAYTGWRAMDPSQREQTLLAFEAAGGMTVRDAQIPGLTRAMHECQRASEKWGILRSMEATISSRVLAKMAGKLSDLINKG